MVTVAHRRGRHRKPSVPSRPGNPSWAPEPGQRQTDTGASDRDGVAGVGGVGGASGGAGTPDGAAGLGTAKVAEGVPWFGTLVPDRSVAGCTERQAVSVRNCHPPAWSPFGQNGESVV